ncbi:hypothetical protein GJV26_27420 [Massilia dura]|uniref:DUF2383 domain-containing protein n=1 Tax=Pseudoduganella dura TaxID=321982 RepID=A0A6I3XI52_9BURK|nr:hypothetical protein [Pseudoduganella dura]MUI16159.1 hypothetical protein [Pseudoduganella dura]GGY10512.1 hypothetical protein GCM10007386_46120 [Pseudoduganella dura]
MTDESLRAVLRELARHARGLHKAMLDVETQYFGAVGGVLEHLQLVTNHPHFAWLLKLSGLMAELDERLDDDEAIEPADAAQFRTAFEQLIGPRAAIDGDFRKRYLALLHDAPEVAIANGPLRQALAKLPQAE